MVTKSTFFKKVHISLLSRCHQTSVVSSHSDRGWHGGTVFSAVASQQEEPVFESVIENSTWGGKGGATGLGRVAHTSSAKHVRIPYMEMESRKHPQKHFKKTNLLNKQAILQVF